MDDETTGVVGMPARADRGLDYRESSSVKRRFLEGPGRDFLKKKVAVITDATRFSDYFPHWKAYYGGLFGEDNLFVVTYVDNDDPVPVDNRVRILKLEAKYSNELRKGVITQIIDALLARYDVVVRCDVDEFIVADPRAFADLAAFIDASQMPYVTAFGMDVVQAEGEMGLDFDAGPLLAQRNACVATASISKTCILSQKRQWSLGFHWTDRPPSFADIYIFHFKFADVPRRAAWYEHLTATAVPGSEDSVRFSTVADQVRAYGRHLTQMQKGQEVRDFHDRSFFDDVSGASTVDDHGMWTFPFLIDDRVRLIPGAFKSLL